MNSKIWIVGILLVSLCGIFSFASAQAMTDAQKQVLITELKAELAQLVAQLNQLLALQAKQIASNSTATQSPTCYNFTYSNWTTCFNGLQTRIITSFSPANCQGGSPITEKTCCVADSQCPIGLHCNSSLETCYGCGDGVCDANNGENLYTCPADCQNIVPTVPNTGSCAATCSSQSGGYCQGNCAAGYNCVPSSAAWQYGISYNGTCAAVANYQAPSCISDGQTVPVGNPNINCCAGTSLDPVTKECKNNTYLISTYGQPNAVWFNGLEWNNCAKACNTVGGACLYGSSWAPNLSLHPGSAVLNDCSTYPPQINSAANGYYCSCAGAKCVSDGQTLTGGLSTNQACCSGLTAGTVRTGTSGDVIQSTTMCLSPSSACYKCITNAYNIGQCNSACGINSSSVSDSNSSCGITNSHCSPGYSCVSGECTVNPPTVACTPSCQGQCGSSDGCGGICQTGTCTSSQTCTAGKCVTPASATTTTTTTNPNCSTQVFSFASPTDVKNFINSLQVNPMQGGALIPTDATIAVSADSATTSEICGLKGYSSLSGVGTNGGGKTIISWDAANHYFKYSTFSSATFVALSSLSCKNSCTITPAATNPVAQNENISNSDLASLSSALLAMINSLKNFLISK